MSITKRYVAVQGNTASKEQLMVMLFETAQRHMRTAIRHFESKQPRMGRPLLDKAAQIVGYLHGTLKRDVSPQLVDTLLEIYTFTAARLTRAIATGSAADIREAERAFAPIAEGFAKAVATTTRQASAAP